MSYEQNREVVLIGVTTLIQSSYDNAARFAREVTAGKFSSPKGAILMLLEQRRDDLRAQIIFAAEAESLIPSQERVGLRNEQLDSHLAILISCDNASLSSAASSYLGLYQMQIGVGQ